jgi:AcrR family transcriptional regulator
MTPPARSGPVRRTSLASGSDARERTLRTAYRLFSQHGVQATGVDRIIAEAGIAKATLYKHFGSKEELVLAALRRREDLWSRGWLEREINRRAGTPRTRLLAIFDAFDEWFRRDDYECCLFINTLLETHDRTSPIARASLAHLANVRAFIREQAEEAGIGDPDAFARQWQLLMMGSITAAAAGDPDAARRARDLATLLLPG